jgi:hypothetical protein
MSTPINNDANNAAANNGHHTGPRPPLRLIKGVKNATDDELVEDADRCERLAMRGGIAVLAGLIIEAILAYRHAPPESFEGNWGSFVADCLVALGVGIEVLFSRLGARRQEELRRRSDVTIAALHAQVAKAEAAAEEAKTLAYINMSSHM